MNPRDNRPTAGGGADARRVALGTPAGFVAFGFGAGLSPVAPGTAGTLAGMVLALPMTGLPERLVPVAIALAFVAGIPICRRTASRLGVHDHGGIVWDEFVGIWLVLMFVPVHWAWWLAGFAAFRVFDIAKPWPIGLLDRNVGGGFGIMLDDLIAAVYAAAVLGVAGLLL